MLKTTEWYLFSRYMCIQEIMDESLGRLYWRLAPSSIHNIPDGSLSAQRAAEPDNVL